MSRTPENLLTATQEALEAVRSTAPLTHCITNNVVVGFTANVLLAIGAAPAMVDIPDEAGMFAGIASGLLINLGTCSAEQRAASIEAATAAVAAGTPWVLDPVAIGALPVRTALAHQLRDLHPSIVRGNASEIMALAELGAGGRGVDSTNSVDDALAAAQILARVSGGAVAVSGATDVVTDGKSVVRLSNGHPVLTKVTGGGCALGALMAAFASVTPDALTGAVAATSVYTVAAEIAAERSALPGSFAVALLDALSEITVDDLAARAVIA